MSNSKRKQVRNGTAPPVIPYDDDLDIVTVATEVYNELRRKCSDSSMQERRLAELQSKLPQCRSIVESSETQRRIASLIHEIRNLRKNVEAARYIEEAKPLIDQYRSLGPAMTVMTTDRGLRSQGGLERMRIIECFLQVTERYSSKRYVCTRKQSSNCPACQQEPLEHDRDSGHLVCPNEDCGYQVNCSISDVISSGPDIGKRVSNSRENFIRMFSFYQAEVPRPPDSCLAEVERQLLRKGIRCDYVRSLPLVDGRRSEYNIQYIVDALQSSDNSAYYHCIYLIAHILWGWEKRDITEYLPQILDCYDTTQAAIQQLRLNCPQFKVTYRLCWHLRTVGLDSRLSHFKRIRPETIMKYENARGEICRFLVQNGSPEYIFEPLQ